MPENTYTKKYIKKDGTVKNYQYKYESKEYTKKFWLKKSSQAKITCPLCQRPVYEFYLEKHQTKPICKKYNKLLSETSEDDIQDLDDILNIFLPAIQN